MSTQKVKTRSQSVYILEKKKKLPIHGQQRNENIKAKKQSKLHISVVPYLLSKELFFFLNCFTQIRTWPIIHQWTIIEPSLCIIASLFSPKASKFRVKFERWKNAWSKRVKNQTYHNRRSLSAFHSAKSSWKD